MANKKPDQPTVKPDFEKKDIDPRSPEFQAKVRAIFDRDLKYGDGPIDFDDKKKD